MPDILFYNYYFDGIEKPLSIQASNQDEARMLLPAAIPLSPLHKDKTANDIIGQTVTEPVTGVSKRVLDGKTYVWAGQEKGWEPEPIQQPGKTG